MLLCPSMMCANFGSLKEEIRLLELSGADIFHLDIMDGQFVPNFGMGLQDIEFICRESTIPCDVHLMCNHPDKYIEMFSKLGVKIIYIHPEADCHSYRTLQSILDCKACPGIAINPGTAISTIEPLLSIAEYVLVMSVNPGFAGQKYLKYTNEKIKELNKLRNKYNYKIILDGGCSFEVIKEFKDKGIDGFILGTSALFGKDRSYNLLMKDLRGL